MSDLAKQLGKRIYFFRKANNISQAALAERAKISNEFMSSIERGAKMPSLLTLEKIARGLGLNMKDLFNFVRTGFQNIRPLSRQVLDLASLIECVPKQRRRRITRVVKILAEPADD
jgi:transcriptional regulator with XRE-family HTH domain